MKAIFAEFGLAKNNGIPTALPACGGVQFDQFNELTACVRSCTEAKGADFA